MNKYFPAEKPSTFFNAQFPCVITPAFFSPFLIGWHFVVFLRRTWLFLAPFFKNFFVGYYYYDFI